MQREFTSPAGLFGNGFVDDHARNWFAIFLLLWRIDPVGCRIDGEAVYFALNWKILELSEMVGIVFVKHRDRATVASNINPSKSRVEFDYIGTVCEREIRDRLVFVEIEYRHQIVFLT